MCWYESIPLSLTLRLLDILKGWTMFLLPFQDVIQTSQKPASSLLHSSTRNSSPVNCFPVTSNDIQLTWINWQLILRPVQPFYPFCLRLLFFMIQSFVAQQACMQWMKLKEKEKKLAQIVNQAMVKWFCA